MPRFRSSDAMTCCDLAYGEKKLTTARVTSENAIHESVDLVLIFRAALGARKLLDCPVALLIFLSGTAGARIVAPDLWLAAHDGFDFAGLFTAGRGALIRPGKIHRRPARRAAPLQFVRRLFRNNLE